MGVTITGIKELDAALAQLEAKVQRKYVRQALNAATKLVEQDFNSRCPVEITEFGDEVGAMRDAAKRYTPKRKRNVQARGLKIDRGRLMQLYFERKGRFPGARRGDSEPFFYPAVVELGGSATEPSKPMRAALYGNKDQIQSIFIEYLQQAVANAGKDSGGDAPDGDERAAAAAAGASVYRDKTGRYQKTKGGFASRADVESARKEGKLHE